MDFRSVNDLRHLAIQEGARVLRIESSDDGSHADICVIPDQGLTFAVLKARIEARLKNNLPEGITVDVKEY